MPRSLLYELEHDLFRDPWETGQYGVPGLLERMGAMVKPALEGIRVDTPTPSIWQCEHYGYPAGYYVYSLIFNGERRYIGKGRGSRGFCLTQGVFRSMGFDNFEGTEIILASLYEAYAKVVEGCLIAMLGRVGYETDGALFNLADYRGDHSRPGSDDIQYASSVTHGVTIGGLRSRGIRSVDVVCDCGHARSAVSIEDLDRKLTLANLVERFRCSDCGARPTKCEFTSSLQGRLHFQV